MFYIGIAISDDGKTVELREFMDYEEFTAWAITAARDGWQFILLRIEGNARVMYSDEGLHVADELARR